MLESYNKIRIVNKEVFERIDSLFEKERKGGLKEIEKGLQDIQECIINTNDYFDDKDKKISDIDVKKIAKKIFETTNDNPEEEVKYQLDEVLKKYDSLGKSEENLQNKNFLQEKKETVLNIINAIWVHSEINLLNKIISPNKTDRKKIKEMRSDNRKIPKEFFTKIAEYYKLSEDWLKYGEPKDYIQAVLNSEFVEEVYSEEECEELLEKMRGEGFFLKIEYAPNNFIYPNKKEVINFAYKIELIPQVDFQTNMNDYIRQNGEQKFLLYLTYVFLKNDKDYSQDKKYINELNKILKPMLKMLSVKRGVPKDVDSLLSFFIKDVLGNDNSVSSTKQSVLDLGLTMFSCLNSEVALTEMKNDLNLEVDVLKSVISDIQPILESLSENSDE